jgi:hypothetical protein
MEWVHYCVQVHKYYPTRSIVRYLTDCQLDGARRRLRGYNFGGRSRIPIIFITRAILPTHNAYLTRGAFHVAASIIREYNNIM